MKRQRAAVAGATVAAVALLVSSALVSYGAIEATQARGVADSRRGQAEDLITFMVGDLRGKLEPLGRLDVLEDVGDKALEYFAALPEEELSKDELFRRSQTLTQIGQVRMAQGNLPAALLRRARGELATALTEHQAAEQIARGLFVRDTSNADWERGLGIIQRDLGLALLALGQKRRAVAELQSSRVRFDELAARDPTNTTWQRHLGAAERARGAWMHALETIEPLARAERQTEILAVWAAALLHLEQMDEAAPVVASLVERGYRDPEFVVLARSKGAL